MRIGVLASQGDFAAHSAMLRSLDAANARGMAVFTGWLRRRGAAIEDLHAAELMPS